MTFERVNLPERTVPRLTPDEERSLALRWREHGDTVARDRIVQAHIDLVRGFIGRLKGTSISREDLFQDGVIGLVKAVDRFDPNEGVRFSTYANYWVRAEIQTAMSSEGGPVRVPRSHEANKVATWFQRVRARIESEIALGHLEPPPDGVEREAARRMGVCPDSISTLLGIAQSRGLPIRSQSGDPEEAEGGLLFSEATPETLLNAQQRQNLFSQAIRDACAELPDRDREVIERRYLTETPETFQTIAEGFGLTRERVRQIEVRALRRIQKKLSAHKGIRRLVSETPD